MNFRLLAALLSFAVASCSNPSPASHPPPGPDSAARSDQEILRQLRGEDDMVNEKMASLRALAPLSLNHLSATVPAEVGAFTRVTSYGTSEAKGDGLCTARYRNETGAAFTLKVYDCAGTDGAQVYSRLYWEAMAETANDSLPQSQVVDFAGGKAIEAAQPLNKQASFTYIDHDRLLVVLESEALSPPALHDVAKKLRLNL